MPENAGAGDSEQEIVHFKEEIESEQANEETILKALQGLSTQTITKPILQKTKVGVLVAKLRQHHHAEIAALATSLVVKWKAAVGKTKKTVTADATTGDTATGDRKRGHPEVGPEEPLCPKIVSCDAQYDGPLTRDEKRNKCREFLFKAFLEGMGDDQRNMLDVKNVCKLVAELEEVLHEVHMEKNSNSKEYNYQFRTIKSNLADKKNPEFNARIYLGAIPLHELAVMASTDMASDAKKRERQKAKKDALEACQSDWDLRNVKRAKGQFPCGKCRSENTTYFQMQTRSSDEPMTTYVTCLNCHNRWKM
eukprot:Gregarina_sp_Poly_1__6170@NODE_3265_length_1224_cov_138_324978_g2073_i0_p1_GENE_NODE_3265_length_1224_cov_138_324978_g2073_i0NODE_3265_length_1224_cov_138_324978_g2073_i0_p1_ORF_typecomplete_len308_score53_62TFIIS_M/PF07500_14/1_8e03TFIIS_M/PF07500_14/3e24TFIIS_C/PF01096_18/1_7e17Med26/PF08711_11/2_4e10Cytochrome_C7/PF14522_6/0_11DUF4189/PF13827_6/4_7e02DUF4189/PF13827_6/1Cytochrome_C554/PF13435_6/1_6e04Cytochrome_C554/PF13435_6/0_15_NODE_3265_length_1224_cov_138_324978_g2073_i01681091